MTATFTRQSAGLRVAGAGTGSGSVASGPGLGEGLACTVTDGVAAASGCRIEVALGGVVTLTATAAPGSLFAGWGGVPGLLHRVVVPGDGRGRDRRDGAVHSPAAGGGGVG